MCGICGIVDLSGKEVSKTIIKNMCKSLSHRGPDNEGIYISSHGAAECRGQQNINLKSEIRNLKISAGLGHRRLNIIDLSSDGNQPMCNESETVWVIQNGEIYNFVELKNDLIKKGHRFTSKTDTEVIIHLYEEYGENCIEKLRGMFALAIWDERDDVLILARDRPGKKPLLYYFDGSILCFASEFCSLLSSGLVKNEINYTAIHSYLSYGYIPGPMSIYKNIYKLQPAHLLVLKNGELNIKKYWELNFANKIMISENEAAIEVHRLLEESVKLRMYSDVPLGAFLSGGIDSTVVVSLMSQVAGKRIKTFSIGFEEGSYNELHYAQKVAQAYNTEHHEFVVNPQVLEILPRLVEHYGEPFADSSAVPTFYVSQQTKQHVTVALNGDGGDEVFAGYERYQAAKLSEIYQRLPKVLRSAISRKFAQSLPENVDRKNYLSGIKRFIEGASYPLNQGYLHWIGVFNERFKKDLYTSEFFNEVSVANPTELISGHLNGMSGLSLVDSLLYVDTMTYLPNDLLVKVDIASMLNSLECRSPFLDHCLMEFVASLPSEFKLKGFIKKYILKKAFNKKIPKEIIKRRKMGFGVPVGAWFKGDLKNFVNEILLSNDSLKRGYFNPDMVKVMVFQHTSGKKEWGPQLWALLMLELWHKRFIDNFN